MSLTKQEIREYVQSGGSYCPYCSSKEIEGTGERNTDGNWTGNEITCLKCGKIWKDVYLLADIYECPEEGTELVKVVQDCLRKE